VPFVCNALLSTWFTRLKSDRSLALAPTSLPSIHEFNWKKSFSDLSVLLRKQPCTRSLSPYSKDSTDSHSVACQSWRNLTAQCVEKSVIYQPQTRNKPGAQKLNIIDFKITNLQWKLKLLNRKANSQRKFVYSIDPFFKRASVLALQQRHSLCLQNLKSHSIEELTYLVRKLFLDSQSEKSAIISHLSHPLMYLSSINSRNSNLILSCKFRLGQRNVRNRRWSE